MTPTQSAIHAFIRDFRAVHPYGPTQAEIAAELGISQPAIHKALCVMQAAGLVRHDVSVARSVIAIQLAEPETTDTLQADTTSSEAMPADVVTS